jgi:hypothetical protein
MRSAQTDGRGIPICHDASTVSLTPSLRGVQMNEAGAANAVRITSRRHALPRALKRTRMLDKNVNKIKYL